MITFTSIFNYTMSHGRLCICDTVSNHGLALTCRLTTLMFGDFNLLPSNRFAIIPDLLGLYLNRCLFSFDWGCLFVLSACLFYLFLKRGCFVLC